jgi:hypothetical protein
MEPTFSMKSASSNDIEDAAIELGVDPAFIEKDWYVVQALLLITQPTGDYFQLVFGGGTSLSKGFQLIERFSEDIDFRVVTKDPTNPVSKSAGKKQRSLFRDQLIANIEQGFGPVKNLKSRNENNKVSWLIEYPTQFQTALSLRPQILVELVFDKPPQIAIELQPIHSMIASLKNTGPEVTELACVSPLETAADKVAALSWRVTTRGDQNDEPDRTLVRHLHDLAALYDRVHNEPLFFRRAIEQVAVDGKRAETLGAELSVSDRLQLCYQQLTNDTRYQQEYTDFVSGMFFGHQPIAFDTAVERFEKLLGGIEGFADL